VLLKLLIENVNLDITCLWKILCFFMYVLLTIFFLVPVIHENKWNSWYKPNCYKQIVEKRFW